ncbi:MAG: hypothetical protein HC924_19400 [Synechococcaceae cyanobacterium SM2_3_2]|nr:hypothetical protein [Synechococcaceae cyanobacterium SM2_3_2]
MADPSTESSGLVSLIAEQNQLLRELTAFLAQQGSQSSLAAVPMGFGRSPRPLYIYCNRSHGSLWYSLSEDTARTPQPIEADALTGIVTKLEKVEATRRNQTVSKLHIHVKADQQRYVLESGLESNFAKAALYTLSLIPITKLKQPITIAVEPGDSEEVLFCRIYNPYTGEAAFAPWDPDTNWDQVLQRAVQKIDTAQERPKSTET